MLRERIAEWLYEWEFSGEDSIPTWEAVKENYLVWAGELLTAIREAAGEGMPLVIEGYPFLSVDESNKEVAKAQRQADIDWLQKQAKGE